MRFTVGREGRVTTAAVGASTLRNPTLETCLVDVVKLCRFANPLDRRPVDLSYTFEFGPSKSNDGTEPTARRGAGDSRRRAHKFRVLDRAATL